MIENYSAINDQPYATKANGYEGLDTEFVYNKTPGGPAGRAVEEMAR